MVTHKLREEIEAPGEALSASPALPGTGKWPEALHRDRSSEVTICLEQEEQSRRAGSGY